MQPRTLLSFRSAAMSSGGLNDDWETQVIVEAANPSSLREVSTYIPLLNRRSVICLVLGSMKISSLDATRSGPSNESLRLLWRFGEKLANLIGLAVVGTDLQGVFEFFPGQWIIVLLLVGQPQMIVICRILGITFDGFFE